MFIGNAAFCQKINFGFKAGTDLHKITGKSFNEQFDFGYHVGAFVEIRVKKIGIQPELYFSQVNTKTANTLNLPNNISSVRTIKLSYLNIPILVNFNFNKIVALQAGPQFGILVNQSGTVIQNGQDAFKNGDFSLAAGLQIKLMKFRFYGRYVIGLSDVNAATNISDQGSWKSQTIHLGVAFSIL